MIGENNKITVKKLQIIDKKLDKINQELSFPTEEINSSGISSEDSEENREEYKKQFIDSISFNDNLLNKGKLINHNINEFI